MLRPQIQCPKIIRRTATARASGANQDWCWLNSLAKQVGNGGLIRGQPSGGVGVLRQRIPECGMPRHVMAPMHAGSRSKTVQRYQHC